MTLKRRFYLSNVRMVLVTIGGFLMALLTTRIIVSIILGKWRIQGHEDMEAFRNQTLDPILLIPIAVFIVFVGVINSMITHKMTKHLTKRFDVLYRGIKQIHENNFSYRIDYPYDDEFHPLCETFNQMAAQLQASTERRLKDEANRRELLAGISHDLRTPLTTILGYIEGLNIGVAATPEMRDKYLTAIKNKADSMEHIIERLFLFSKLDMDEFPLALRRVDIMRAIADMVEELADEYAQRGLVITMTENPSNVLVSTDTIFFRNALINIVENSALYKTKETGHMAISASIVDNSILIRFADDGPGVSADVLPKLFDAFYRTDPSRHTKGSGLGLAISAKIVERCGGTIYAEPSDSGGLAIVIRLPVEHEGAA